MAIASPPPPTRDDSFVSLRSTLSVLRRRIRAYVAVEGIAAVVAVAGLLFWLVLGLDRLFEPRIAVRTAWLACAGIAVAVVFYRRFLRRFFARFSDSGLALLLERRYRNLKTSLLTAVELEPRELTQRGRTMLDATRREAHTRLSQVRLEEFFDPRPRRQAVAAALLLTASIGVFAAAAPTLFRFGVDRLLGRTDELWPRRTHLTVEGFVGGERVVARGSDLDLVVLADARKVLPDRVELYYESEDGAVENEVILDREGVAKPGVDDNQRYKTPLRGLTSSLLLDIRGGDARLRDLKIRVVERPRVSLDLVCRFPPYTGRADGTLYRVSGILPLPQGTIVTVEAHADKQLTHVVAKLPDGAGGVKEQVVELPDGDEERRNFKVELGRIDADSAATFQLFDTDGIDNTELLTLQAVPDGAPAFPTLARQGVDASVTAQARLPFVGKATDDYGLARLWFDVAVDGANPHSRPFSANAAGRREIQLSEVIEVRELAGGESAEPLKPGRTFNVTAMAQDNRNLPAAPEGNITAGDAFAFTVVSDADLLRLLEGREIMFREQFKALIEKVTRDRDALVSVGSADDKPESTEEGSENELRRDRSSVIVDQVRSHTKENRAETTVVAGGFLGIVEELLNNRVADGERLQRRLSDDIALPLKLLAERRFAEYEAKLTELKLAVDMKTKDATRIESLRRETQREADAILVEMNVVLNKMLELESFKEAVDLLRSIIAMQKEIGEKTKAQRQSKLRLLGD